MGGRSPTQQAKGRQPPSRTPRRKPTGDRAAPLRDLVRHPPRRRDVLRHQRRLAVVRPRRPAAELRRDLPGGGPTALGAGLRGRFKSG